MSERTAANVRKLAKSRLYLAPPQEFGYDNPMYRAPEVIIAFVIVGQVSACEWDRDTLEIDMKRFPTTVEALIGKFDRQPPLFYSMRRDRVAREIDRNPNQPDKYDDIAVAESRLGNQDAAIAWMNRKSKLRLTDDQRYRMYSNIGTFRLVKWMRGDHRALAPVLDQGIKDIEAGLAINPHAHFDREPVQLEFMRWARKVFDAPSHDYAPLDRAIASKFTRELAIKGVTGMIVMGYAWMSPDLIGVLGSTHVTGFESENGGIRWIARMRIKELNDSKVKAVADYPESFIDYGPQVDDAIQATYPVIRRQAEEYTVARQAYMNARLSKGRHPDTDPTFWKEWNPPKFELDLSALRRANHMESPIDAAVAMWTSVFKWTLGVISAIVVALIWRFYRWRKR